MPGKWPMPIDPRYLFTMNPSLFLQYYDKSPFPLICHLFAPECFARPGNNYPPLTNLSPNATNYLTNNTLFPPSFLLRSHFFFSLRMFRIQGWMMAFFCFFPCF